MVKLRSLKLEGYLTQDEIIRFHKEWQKHETERKSKAFRVSTLSPPYFVHNNLPVITIPWQFEDKPVFRAKVMEKHLIRINPYYNSDKYLMPLWHLHHYWVVAEQFWHAIKTISVPRYNRYMVKDIGQPDIKKPIFWHRGSSNGNISITGISKPRRGSWQLGNAIEQFTGIFYDDRESIEYGRANALCFISFRNYVQEYNSLINGNKNSFDKLRNLILDQNRQHKRLTTPRTDIKDDDRLSQELIQKCQDKTITLEELDFYFSLYDLPK